MKKLYTAMTRKLTAIKTRSATARHRGDFVMDHAVVFIVIVVIGILVLGLLKDYIQGDFATNMTTKLNSLWN